LKDYKEEDVVDGERGGNCRWELWSGLFSSIEYRSDMNWVLNWVLCFVVWMMITWITEGTN
jgi:hypothetical protein